MTVEEAIGNRRTIRKFQQKAISQEILLGLVNAARLAPSTSNLQPIKYKIVNEKSLVDALFPLVRWAAYIAPEGTPKEGEHPVAFIVVCDDTAIRKEGYETDAGAAIENLILTAETEGIGVCWMGAVDRVKIHELLGLDKTMVIHTVLALGYKAEHPVLETAEATIKYYKDKDGTLHVPKRSLSSVLL